MEWSAVSGRQNEIFPTSHKCNRDCLLYFLSLFIYLLLQVKFYVVLTRSEQFHVSVIIVYTSKDINSCLDLVTMFAWRFWSRKCEFNATSLSNSGFWLVRSCWFIFWHECSCKSQVDIHSHGQTCYRFLGNSSFTATRVVDSPQTD